MLWWVFRPQLASSSSPTTVRLNFHSSPDQPLAPVELKIGETTSEDILCELGSAIRTFWKEDVRRSTWVRLALSLTLPLLQDRLTIHTASLGSKNSPASSALEREVLSLSFSFATPSDRPPSPQPIPTSCHTPTSASPFSSRPPRPPTLSRKSSFTRTCRARSSSAGRHERRGRCCAGTTASASRTASRVSRRSSKGARTARRERRLRPARRARRAGRAASRRQTSTTCSASSRLRRPQMTAVNCPEDAATTSRWCWTGRRERGGEASRASRRVSVRLFSPCGRAVADPCAVRRDLRLPRRCARSHAVWRHRDRLVVLSSSSLH